MNNTKIISDHMDGLVKLDIFKFPNIKINKMTTKYDDISKKYVVDIIWKNN